MLIKEVTKISALISLQRTEFVKKNKETGTVHKKEYPKDKAFRKLNEPVEFFSSFSALEYTSKFCS